MREQKILEVVAALIWQDGKFFACQRPEHKARGGLWEFVGGKVEKGETKEEALIRECREELGVDIRVQDVFMDVLHQYPDITVHLTLFNARFTGEKPKMLEHQAFLWVTPEEADETVFCPADKEILDEIRRRTLHG
ncbi:MAG: (deoxy)nucleoside triphosphate pyrophosphohydrolase [Clostridia bacterium]|nr:(deoxy)nucleoside triphosphate pyrophosphohydrolase [Clostridia bacterium]